MVLCCYASFFLINCLPTKVLKEKTPYELVYEITPNLNDVKVFGSLCFASSLQRNRSKFDIRARKCVFLGYQNGTKGYVVLDIKSRDIFVSRDVGFHEKVFPYANHIDHVLQTNNTCQISYFNPFFESINYNAGNVQTEHNHSHTESQIEKVTDSLRRSTRNRRAPSFLQDYHCQLSSYTNKNSKDILYLISSRLSYSKLSSSHLKYVLVMSTNREPSSYSEAINFSEWRKAMTEEIRAFEQNETWEIVDPPRDKKPIGCRWVFKVKYNANGEVECYKGRLVAKDYTQLEGIDYLDTFSPVAKLTTIRFLFAIASAQNWFLKQLNVNNTFLHGDLDEEVYMLPPLGVLIIKAGRSVD